MTFDEMFPNKELHSTGFDQYGICYRKTMYGVCLRTDFVKQTANGYVVGVKQPYYHFYKPKDYNPNPTGFFAFNEYLRKRNATPLEKQLQDTGHILIYNTEPNYNYANVFIESKYFTNFDAEIPVDSIFPGHIVATTYDTPQYLGQKPFIDKWGREHYKVTQWSPEFVKNVHVVRDSDFDTIELDNASEILTNVADFV